MVFEKQLSFFAEEPSKPPVDTDVIAAHIARVADTPRHRALVDAAYDRDAVREGLMPDALAVEPRPEPKPFPVEHRPAEANIPTPEEADVGLRGLQQARRALPPKS